jgi:preprotein translocase subunit SecE
MARNPGSTPTLARSRGGRPGAKPPAVRPTAAPAEAPKKPFNPVQFVREVRAEARKITWTSWRETWITSVMVFIMVVVTAVFFLVTDGAIGWIMQFLLKLAAGGN